ncbi:adenylate/guanylate cyclase domain-containing protein [Thermodesulfobacteriota bacterium]
MPPKYNIKKNTSNHSKARSTKESIKKMAVLFTDIVASTNYFKTHGDIAGRRMLKQHQDMVSPLITEFGGAVVKLLGDSVMAYFLNPKEAFKSAIKVQQSFQIHNMGKEEKDQIHIRICVHFGEGIEEENDIYGDVVNMAAKVLPMVGVDQIFISKELHQYVQDLPSVHFSQVAISSKKRVFTGLRLFNVTWENNIYLEPLVKTLLYVKPVWTFNKEGLSKTWNSMVNSRRKPWSSNQIEKERILADKSIGLIVRGVSSALTVAANIMEYIKVNLGDTGALVLPIQIIIESGPYLRAGKVLPEALKVDWGKIETGFVYLASDDRKKIKNCEPFKEGSKSSGKSGSYLKLLLHEQKTSDPHQFLYQNALVQGSYDPCFYCGDRNHPASNCPSKQYTEITHAINELGYFTLEKINVLFFNYLNSTVRGSIASPASIKDADSPGPGQLARNGFYEMKMVYQLRFFKTLWNLKEENWSKIKTTASGKEKGGLLWIGVDCVRVSNTEQAESIFEELLAKKIKDYKIFCAIGFLKIDQNDLSQAKAFFQRAIELTTTTPQKIFIFFLLFRIHCLMGELVKARQMIGKIIRINPYCHEALYQEILFKFQTGDKTFALRQLLKLIKINREYYVIALIDPELSKYSREIHPMLNQLHDELRRDSNRMTPNAEVALERLNDTLGKDEKEVMEAKSKFEKIKELIKTDSYFGYIDALFYCESIINMSHQSITIREKKLSKMFHNIKDGLNRCEAHIIRLDYPSLTDSISLKIRTIWENVDDIQNLDNTFDVKEYKKVLNRLKVFSAEVVKIKSRLDRLENTAHIMRFATKFIRNSLFIQAANLAMALILLPIMIHYLSFLIPSLQFSPRNIWHYQKVVMILGAISGLILASLLTRTDSSG